MSLAKWIVCCTLGVGVIISNPGIAHGQGKGKGHNKHRDDDQGEDSGMNALSTSIGL